MWVIGEQLFISLLAAWVQSLEFMWWRKWTDSYKLSSHLHTCTVYMHAHVGTHVPHINMFFKRIILSLHAWQAIYGYCVCVEFRLLDIPSRISMSYILNIYIIFWKTRIFLTIDLFLISDKDFFVEIWKNFMA